VARIFSPARLVAAGLVLLGAALVLYLIPSNKYLLLPDRARPVAPAVSVLGEHDDHDGGGIYYVAVEVKKASMLEKLFPGIHDGATLVPATDVVAPGESEQQHRRAELHQMATSQEIAGAVALRALGKHVVVRSPGTIVTGAVGGGPASGKVKPLDLVVAVDGHRTPFFSDLRRLIGRHRPGDPVKLTIRRGDRLLMLNVKTIRDPHDPKRPFVGVFTNCAIQTFSKITLPLPVHIDLGQVGGPSAGLAFALDVFEETGHNVDRGGMRIIPVNSFRQALRALATLPKKRPVA
jgi:PDZ domain-containing protein